MNWFGQLISKNLRRFAQWLRQLVSKSLRRFAQWLGRRGLEKTSAKITLLAFLGVSLLAVLIVYKGGEGLSNTNLGAAAINVFADLFVSLLLALLGIATWFATSYYKEEEFTVHVFSYDPKNLRMSLPRRWLAQDISEDFGEEKDGEFVSFCEIDQPDEAVIDKQIAEELLRRNTASIAILPFREMAQGMLEICRHPESTHNSLWTKRKEVEGGRTFALFVTYDPQLENSAPEMRSLRFFSTPLIDTAAIVSDIINQQEISRLVLVADDPGGSFQGIENALQHFVREKIKRVNRFENRIKEMVRALPGDYVPQANEKVAVFVMTVDPSIALLQKLNTLNKDVCSKGGEIVAIYVPPTWVRNWRLEDAVYLLSHWNMWLEGRKLLTVLPEGLADYLHHRSEDNAFDIISFYTQGAFKFALRLRQAVIEQGGAPYNRIAQTLENIAHKLVHDDVDNAAFSFQRIFSTGEIYYDPIIVSFQPNIAKTDFSIGIGREGR